MLGVCFRGLGVVMLVGVVVWCRLRFEERGGWCGSEVAFSTYGYVGKADEGGEWLDNGQTKVSR